MFNQGGFNSATLNGAGQASIPGAGQVNVESSVTAAGNVIFAASASIVCAGASVSLGVRRVLATAAINASVNVAATGTHTTAIAANVSVSATVQAASSRTAFATGVVNGLATVVCPGWQSQVWDRIDYLHGQHNRSCHSPG